MKIFYNKIIFSLVFILILFTKTLFATNYYVSSIVGNDNANNGLSISTPFATIQKAADNTNPGDTVFVMNGTYTNVCDQCLVATITRPGTASNWIVYINYPTHAPLLQFNAWGGFMVRDNAAYIEINGFTIRGNNANCTLADALNQIGSCANPGPNFNSFYNGNGLAADGRGDAFGTGHPHHIRFVNNNISECGGGGISAIQSDYVTVENNTVYNNCWYTVFGASGISFYQSWNFDNNVSDYKMIVRNNKLYGNELRVPWIGCCCISDGNGIIIDDGKNTQNNSPIGPYLGRTLVANNITTKNGGSGIHGFESENIDIVNNTSYQNSQSAVLEGEIFANTCNNVNILNNIMYAKTNEPANQNTSNYNNTNVNYDYNLYFNTNNIIITGAHDVQLDPRFVNASLDFYSANFHLLSNSGAIDNGTTANAPIVDFENHPRPSGNGFDIGAYEFSTVVLPIKISGLLVKCLDNFININWKVFTSENINKYIIQSSSDGFNWKNEKEVFNNNTTNSAQDFSVNILKNDNQFFRVAVIKNTNDIELFTNIVNSGCKVVANDFIVYPSLFSKKISINWKGKNVTGILTLLDASGKKIKIENVIFLPNTTYDVEYLNISQGIYFLEFTRNDGEKWLAKIIKVE
jgi:hypothetical protein